MWSANGGNDQKFPQSRSSNWKLSTLAASKNPVEKYISIFFSYVYKKITI